MGAHRTRTGLARGTREREPEGLGEAVAAGAVTLALMTALAFVGFAWERSRARSAHALAVDLVERLSADGREALMPPWSGTGTGPASKTAKATFDAVHNLGTFTAGSSGSCRLMSKPAMCTGSRYDCTVEGQTPSGPVGAAIGLCQGGDAAAWTFDALDVTVPGAGIDTGNRADVEATRDGLIRYGSGPPPPIVPPRRLHLRGIALPFIRPLG